MISMIDDGPQTCVLQPKENLRAKCHAFSLWDESERAHTALRLSMRRECAAVVGRSLPPAATAPGRSKLMLNGMLGVGGWDVRGWGLGVGVGRYVMLALKKGCRTCRGRSV